jgi:hypothetical protein
MNDGATPDDVVIDSSNYWTGVPGVSDGGLQTFDATPIVQGWVSSPAENNGVYVSTPQEVDLNAVEYYYGAGAGHADSQDVPVLRVESDVQSGVGLEATGLIGPKVCQDLESGCSKEYVDPTDPGWASRPADGDEGLMGNLAVSTSAPTCSSPTTNCFTRQTVRDLGVVVDFTKVVDGDGSALLEPANLGISVALGQPGQAGRYNPCSNPADDYKLTCLNDGYWFAKNHFPNGRNNFSGGFFADNKPATDAYRRKCPAPCTHYWGQRVQRADIEVYPRLNAAGQPRDNSRVNVRWTNFFPEWDTNGTRRNRRLYADFGKVGLARLGDLHVARMVGQIVRSGRQVAKGEVRVRTFEDGASPNFRSLATATSSGGHGLTSFSVPNTNDAGRYDLGAVYADTYNVKIQDVGYENRNLSNPPIKQTRCYRILVDDLNDFANFDVGRADFGRSGAITCPF